MLTIIIKQHNPGVFCFVQAALDAAASETEILEQFYTG